MEEILNARLPSRTCRRRCAGETCRCPDRSGRRSDSDGEHDRFVGPQCSPLSRAGRSQSATASIRLSQAWRGCASLKQDL